MAISQKLHERIKAFAAELREEIYGEAGAPQWGTTFTEIEDTGVEIGDALTCAVVGQSLQRQAARGGDTTSLVCAVCGRGSEQDEVEPRIVRTRRGETQWLEPKGYCKHCRKAFFPAVESPGDRTG
jgi:hypothetical protein